jgi:hypothetical protein
VAGLAVAPVGLFAQWQATVSAEGRAVGSPGPPAAPDLSPWEAALTLDASLHQEWSGGKYELRLSPYVRWDPQGERSRLDLRELSVGLLGQRWELRVGFQELFWGAAESAHLVDVVNQRDLGIRSEGYRKMGQPMIDLTAIRRWGTVDLLLIPWFRERTFDGHAGALWAPLRVDASQPVYESGSGRAHLGWAVRWSHTLGSWDLGLSHFQGTLREPGFVPARDAAGNPVLAPRYDVGGHTGLDLQLSTGAWVWKLEAVTADREPGRYVAAAGGLEYGIGDYLALFAEYLYDSRGRAAFTSFEDDLFLGGRLFLPDGQVQAGVYLDRRTLNTVLSLAVGWRLGESLTVELEAGTFVGDELREPALARRQHSYVSLELTRYF